MTTTIRAIVDSFAKEGFVALAPDLYHGKTTEEPDEAQKQLMAMNMEEAEKEMRGAVKYLLDHPKCNGQVGSVGFCAGGGLSVWAAASNPQIGAAVTYYYVMPHGKPDFSKIKAPVLGHFGTEDDFISEDDAKALRGRAAGGRRRGGLRVLRGRGTRVRQRPQPARHLRPGSREEGVGEDHRPSSSST